MVRRDAAPTSGWRLPRCTPNDSVDHLDPSLLPELVEAAVKRRAVDAEYPVIVQFNRWQLCCCQQNSFQMRRCVVEFYGREREIDELRKVRATSRKYARFTVVTADEQDLL